MEKKFEVTKEQRKALVAAIGAFTGCKPEYQGAPSFAFVVGDFTIDKNGTLIYDEQTDAEAVRGLLMWLADQGFVCEGGIEEIAAVTEPSDVERLEAIKLHEEPSPTGDGITVYYMFRHSGGSENSLALCHKSLSLIKEKADKYIICAEVCYLSEAEMEQFNIEFCKLPHDWNILPCSVQEGLYPLLPEHLKPSDNETPIADAPDAESDGDTGKLSINMPLCGFTALTLDNLEKLVAAKAWIIKKMTGADALPIEQDEEYLHFPWFKQDASAAEIDTYSRLVAGLCETVKKKQRVTASQRKLEDGDNEKFKARCFLLSLGFIGEDSAQARKILLAPMSGSGSHKRGDHKREIAVQKPMEITAPSLCRDCFHHCYYTDGPLRTNSGDIVDTSKRTPEKYTHYCLGAPSGFRKLKGANDWHGSEPPAKWCPLSVEITADSGENNAEAIGVRDDGSSADSAATGGDKGALRDCLACANSLSEAAEKDGDFDRLFCVIKQTYVSDDGSCGEFNS